MLIAFIIHKLLKLACGPQFSQPSGLSQLRPLCVGLARGPPVALSQDHTLSKGPLSLEEKTKDSQLCGFRQPWEAGPFLSAVWKCPADQGAVPSLALEPLLCPASPLRFLLQPAVSDLPARCRDLRGSPAGCPHMLVTVHCGLCLSPSLRAGRPGLRRAGPHLCSLGFGPLHLAPPDCS